jgi:hypothetical protein
MMLYSTHLQVNLIKAFYIMMLCFTGKPKAFFLQCCRGDLHQDTVVQPDSDDEDSDKLRVPADGDILIAHATTEGKSFKSTPCF